MTNSAAAAAAAAASAALSANNLTLMPSIGQTPFGIPIFSSNPLQVHPVYNHSTNFPQHHQIRFQLANNRQFGNKTFRYIALSCFNQN